MPHDDTNILPSDIHFHSDIESVNIFVVIFPLRLVADVVYDTIWH